MYNFKTVVTVWLWNDYLLLYQYLIRLINNRYRTSSIVVDDQSGLEWTVMLTSQPLHINYVWLYTPGLFLPICCHIFSTCPTFAMTATGSIQAGVIIFLNLWKIGESWFLNGFRVSILWYLGFCKINIT